MIGAISFSAQTYKNPYALRTYAAPTGKANLPVEPVQPAKAVQAPTAGARSPWSAAAVYPGEQAAPSAQSALTLPTLREGTDPAEMAIRGRIRTLTGEEFRELVNIGRDSRQAMAGKRMEEGERKMFPFSEEAQNALRTEEEAKSAQEVMEEAECQTCKNRKYQDGSDDPGVSFKNPTNIAPEQAASAVRGHEMEHVVREQAKAQREDRRVVQQSVTLHTDICPECGDVFISGGTTRTTTKANPQQEQEQAEMNLQKSRTPFERFV